MRRSLELARRRIGRRPEAAVDATGLESRRVSRYYVVRCGRRHARYVYVKLTVVCHTTTHLYAAAVVSVGPSNDSPQFRPAMIQAAGVIRWDRVLADAGYDGEHNHALCRETLGIRSTVIALNPRRDGRIWPKERYRRQMRRRFHRRVYANRAQVESATSRDKRLLGCELRARKSDSQTAECQIRVLTHNIMILRRSA
jgi:transposase